MNCAPARRAVLLVGAHVGVIELVSGLFPGTTWDVECAANNESALSRVRQKPYELVLTSEQTRAKEDIQLLRGIRRIRPHTRMIILTDESTPAEVVEAMRANAFSFFTAPFTLSELGHMVEAAITAPPWDDGIEIVSATPSWIQLSVRCDLTTAERLVQFLHEIGEHLPDPERECVSIAFREMLLNAIEYGGQFDPSQFVEISYLRSRRALSCRITDPGKGFSLDEIPHAAVSNPAHDPVQHLAHRAEQNLRPGGLGVLLAKKLVDELIYSEKGNEVIMIKYLDKDIPQELPAQHKPGN
jgi:anti-sigma regulatory factor (Ser/Thr protein kinase)/ActR/RegA family two-component response regulator